MSSSPTSLAAGLSRRLAGLSRGRFLLGLAALALLTRLPFAFTDLLNGDEGGWWMGAKIWRAGGVPYLDFIDNKPPLIYVLYALPQFLGIESLHAVHLLALLFVLAGALLVGELSSGLAPLGEESRRGGARLAALLYVGLTALGPSRQFLPLNTESAAMLPMAAAMLFYTRARLGTDEIRNLVLAGALLGVAGLIRQSLWFCLPLFALELFWPARVRGEESARESSLRVLLRWSFFGAGFAAVLALFVGYLAATGIAAQAWYWIVTANRLAVDASPPLAFHLQRFARNVLPSLALALPLWILALRGLRRECWADDARFRLALLWMGTALVALWTGSLGGRWLGHYYIPAIAPLAAVAGARLAALLERDGSPGTLGARLGNAAIVLVTVGALAFALGNVGRTLRGAYEEVSPELLGAAARIELLTNESDAVYIWGFAQSLYYRARRLPANRFIAPNTPISGYLFGAQEGFGSADLGSLVVPEQFALFMADLRAGRPKLFLDYAENDFHYFGRHSIVNYPELAFWLAEGYRRLPDQGPIVFYERVAP